MGNRDQAGARVEQSFELVEIDSPASLTGTTRSSAPVCSQTICQGTIFE